MANRAFLLHGVACGRCGHPGYRHDPRTGRTEHVVKWMPPCTTKPPTTTAPTGDAR